MFTWTERAAEQAMMVCGTFVEGCIEIGIKVENLNAIAELRKATVDRIVAIIEKEHMEAHQSENVEP